MLDFVYYPLSAVLRFWHEIFAAALGPASGVAWTLALMFLTITFRAPLLYPSIMLERHHRKMEDLTPRVKTVQARYPHDRKRQAEETTRLIRELRVMPVFGWLGGISLSCISRLAPILVFLGLLHILRCFDRTGTPSGLPIPEATAPLSAEQNAATANYLFTAADVQSFLGAGLFGATLNLAPITAGDAFIPVALVALIVAVLVAGVSHINGRGDIARRSVFYPQEHPIRTFVILWGGPIGAIVAGVFLPIGVMVYFATAGVWHYLHWAIMVSTLNKHSESAA